MRRVNQEAMVPLGNTSLFIIEVQYSTSNSLPCLGNEGNEPFGYVTYPSRKGAAETM